MQLEILEFPDERLRRVCEPVTRFDAALKKLVDNMFQTMYAAPGIGLAAPQVNQPIRLLVVDVMAQEQPKPMAFVNPEIVASEGLVEWEEGCLSVPGFTADVERAAKVSVRAQDVKGENFEIEAEGLLAIAVQHEMDHLEGVLFVDHLSRLKRSLFLKKYRKLQQQRLQA